jgi:hypothetical protein
MGIGDYQFGHLQPLDITSGSKKRAKGNESYHLKFHFFDGLLFLEWSFLTHNSENHDF